MRPGSLCSLDTDWTLAHALRATTNDTPIPVVGRSLTAQLEQGNLMHQRFAHHRVVTIAMVEKVLIEATIGHIQLGEKGNLIEEPRIHLVSRCHGRSMAGTYTGP